MEMEKSAKFYYFLCTITMNAMKQVRDHNAFKHLRKISKAKDLGTKQDAIQYIHSLNMNEACESCAMIKRH